MLGHVVTANGFFVEMSPAILRKFCEFLKDRLINPKIGG